jgi:hypothetical protein
MGKSTKQALAGVGALIGLYLVLVHYSGFVADVKGAGSGATGLIKTLQGR